MFHNGFHTTLQYANKSDATVYQLSANNVVKSNFGLITKLLQQAKENVGSFHLVECSRGMEYHKKTGMTKTLMLFNGHNPW